MAANGYRYNELPENNVLLQNGLITWYDFVTNKTYSARIGNILSGTTNPDDVWNAMFEYSEGQIVSYNGKIWIATAEPGNIGQPPSGASIFWAEEPDPEPGTNGWATNGTTELTGPVVIDATGNDLTIGNPSGPELGILPDQVYLTKGDPNGYGFVVGLTDQTFVTGAEVHLQADSGNETLELSATNGISMSSGSNKVQIGGKLTIATGIFGDGDGFKHKRQTATIFPTSETEVTMTWTTPFTDADYTPVVTVLETDGGGSIDGTMSVVIIEQTTVHIIVRIIYDGVTGFDSIVNAIAIHD